MNLIKKLSRLQAERKKLKNKYNNKKTLLEKSKIILGSYSHISTRLKELGFEILESTPYPDELGEPYDFTDEHTRKPRLFQGPDHFIVYSSKKYAGFAIIKEGDLSYKIIGYGIGMFIPEGSAKKVRIRSANYGAENHDKDFDREALEDKIKKTLRTI